MKAVVLAAGKGQRLWPLTENRPKPMIPVANKPILEHIVETLEAASIEEAILVVGSNRERVQNYFGDGHERDIEISYIVQEQQLGTGHALLQAESQIGESFIALNGDRIINADLIERIWDQHVDTEDPVIGVKRIDNPSQYGVVDIDEGDVTGIKEQPHPRLTTSDFINVGVYAFSPDIFPAIRRTESHGEQALTDTLADLIDSQQVHVTQYQGMWLDVSEPWDLLTVNDALISYEGPPETSPTNVDASAVVAEAAIVGDGVAVHPQAAVLQGVTLGDNVRVGPGAVLENTVVLSDAKIGAGTVVTDCIVGANATIGPNTTIEGGSADVVLNDAVHHDVTFGGLIGDNVDVGGNATIETGSIIGNDTTIEGGSVVSGRIDDDSRVLRG